MTSANGHGPNGVAGGAHDDGSPAELDHHAVVRSEERLHVGTALQEAGRVLVRKVVGDRHDVTDVERDVEDVEMERSPAEAGDTGEIITLPDGSVSIPVFEEEIVIQKRLVVRERVVLRKYTTTQLEQVEADVRVERIEILPTPDVADRVDAPGDASALVRVEPSPEPPPPAEPTLPDERPQPRPRRARSRNGTPRSRPATPTPDTDNPMETEDDER